MATSMFDMGSMTNDVKTSTGSSFLKPGIHNVKFKGIEKTTLETTMGSQQVMNISFSGDDGNHNQTIFAPRDNERTSGTYGDNPSPAEQFMCICRQIISSLNPVLDAAINDGSYKFAATSFEGFIDLMIKATEKAVDKEVQIKLLPRQQYATLPMYPARINREGVLYVSTKFIGENLTLSSYEMDQIKKAAEAKPTDMSTGNEDLISDMKEETSKIQDVIDDLPF